MDTKTRSIIGRIGGFAKAAKYPPQELTRAARQGAFQKFLDEVDKEFPGLSDAERYRRAEAKRREHMARIALKSRKTRQRKTRDRQTGERR